MSSLNYQTQVNDDIIVLTDNFLGGFFFNMLSILLKPTSNATAFGSENKISKYVP